MKTPKTAVKTAVEARGIQQRRIPQPHGGALLSGGVPGNRGGSGRPRSEVRLAALDGAAKAVPRLQEIVTNAGAAPKDVIAASRVLLEFGVGRQLEIEDTTPTPKLTGADTVKRLATLMPGVLRNGEFSTPQLLAFRDAIEVALKVRALMEVRDGQGAQAPDLRIEGGS